MEAYIKNLKNNLKQTKRQNNIFPVWKYLFLYNFKSEPENYMCLCVCVCVYIYIYIYIYDHWRKHLWYWIITP